MANVILYTIAKYTCILYENKMTAVLVYQVICSHSVFILPSKIYCPIDDDSSSYNIKFTGFVKYIRWSTVLEFQRFC